MTTKAYYEYLRLLAREDGAPGSREARKELDASGRTWTKDIRNANVRANRAASLRGDLPAMFATPKTTTINSKPTQSGARAIARARTRKTS